MKSFVKKIGFVFVLLCVGFIFAQESGQTSVPNLFNYTLDNGLELFVAEDDSAPLVYIDIAVRAGAIAQTEQTAGLFHLFEHLIFSGNQLYSSGSEFEAAVKRLGAIEKNGETGVNYVNYFFTVPSDCLEKGLEFWSYAIRTPLLTEESIAEQKKVVIAEIEGRFSEPGMIQYSLVNGNMFPKYPYRLDVGGTSENVRNCTLDILQDMQKKYYIPNNSALFVGGDVSSEEVYELVKKIFGTWERGEDPWKEERDLQLTEPFDNTEYAIMPTDGVSPEQASVFVIFKGPDLNSSDGTEAAATTFFSLLNNPSSSYISKLLSLDVLNIPDSSYIDSFGNFGRENTLLYFYSVLFSANENLAQRVKLLESTLCDEIFPEIVDNKKYFTKTQFKKVLQRGRDSYFINTETAKDILSEVKFCWLNSSKELFFTEQKEVTKSDIDVFMNKYLIGKKPLVVVRLNPEVYELQKKDFMDAGFVEYNKDNAYWWNK